MSTSRERAENALRRADLPPDVEFADSEDVVRETSPATPTNLEGLQAQINALTEQLKAMAPKPPANPDVPSTSAGPTVSVSMETLVAMMTALAGRQSGTSKPSGVTL